MKALANRNDQTCSNYRTPVANGRPHGGCDARAGFVRSAVACASPTSSHSDSLYWLAVVSLGAR